VIEVVWDCAGEGLSGFVHVTVIEALWNCRILEMRLPHVWVWMEWWRTFQI